MKLSACSTPKMMMMNEWMNYYCKDQQHWLTCHKDEYWSTAQHVNVSDNCKRRMLSETSWHSPDRPCSVLNMNDWTWRAWIWLSVRQAASAFPSFPFWVDRWMWEYCEAVCARMRQLCHSVTRQVVCKKLRLKESSWSLELNSCWEHLVTMNMVGNLLLLSATTSPLFISLLDIVCVC